MSHAVYLLLPPAGGCHVRHRHGWKMQFPDKAGDFALEVHLHMSSVNSV